MCNRNNYNKNTDTRAGSYLAQWISIAIQRSNADSVLGTLPTSSGLVSSNILQSAQKQLQLSLMYFVKYINKIIHVFFLY